MGQGEITAVVGNFQGEAVLGDCLQSLAEQTRAPRSVIVVDAGSTDRSASVAERFGAAWLRTENRGVGWLYNVGARAAATPLVLLCNNDVAFEPECLELLAAALEQDTIGFAADPTQLAWEGGTVIHARTEISRGPLLRQPLPGFRVDQTVPATDVVPTLFANGAAMLVCRERLLALGGFDESFFMEFEEIDVCVRAWLRGWTTVYVPEARVRHHVASTTGRERAQRRRVASAHYNLIRFALKCLPVRGVARVLAGELLRLPAHPLLVAPAFARAAGCLREILRERATVQPSGATFEWLLAGQPAGTSPLKSSASRSIRRAIG
ncbi:MAG TPA: glycosyltransferase family 2 protein [Gaiellaceae bacterium]|nr:glycosyltransferase family 2 protein [Gaiellaceae bacterium]